MLYKFYVDVHVIRITTHRNYIAKCKHLNKNCNVKYNNAIFIVPLNKINTVVFISTFCLDLFFSK